MSAPLAFEEFLAVLGGETDTYVVITRLSQLDPKIASGIYDKLQRELYWKRKDVPTMVAISRAGIQHGLTSAQRASEGMEAELLRGGAKALAYNLASFTWPGWDQAGIVLTPSDIAIGLDAARLNLRLAEELLRPSKAKANAWWVLGAQQLAVGRPQLAAISFINGAKFAVLAGESTSELMLKAFAALAAFLAHAAEPAAREKYDQALAALQNDGSEDAQEYVAQLTTALAVFQRPKA